MDLRDHRIIGFSGHMTDAPNRATPRFPEARVSEVQARVRKAMERQGKPLHGVSSGARGGDIIFLETVLALGGTATVLLPFPPDDFKKTSVGQGWDERFDRVLSAPGIEVRPPLHPKLPAAKTDQDAAFEACNVLIIENLTELAQLANDEHPLFLTVFRETGAQKVGGTWDAIDRWRKHGGAVQIIDPLE